MADLPPPGAAQEAGLADGEWREVVVQHESALRFALDPVQALGVGGGAQGHGGQGLGLAPGEQGGAVGAGQDADLAGEVADLVESTAVQAQVPFHHLFAQDDVLQLVPETLGEAGLLGLLLAEPFEHLRFQFVLLGVGLELVLDPHRVGERLLPVGRSAAGGALPARRERGRSAWDGPVREPSRPAGRRSS